MKNYSQIIMEYAALHPDFGLQDIYAYLDGDTGISRQTISWHLTKLTESGRLHRIGHGKYALQTKQQFTLKPTEEERNLFDVLQQKWPFAHFCIYNGSVISPLLHHLAINNITYVETERDAVSVVFHYLHDAGLTAYLRPSAKFIYNYIDLAQPAFIIKPLVSESPVQKHNGLLVPTLEKLLVDTQKDPDFSYLQGAEGANIFRNALSLYNINESRLLRYASRRGIREEIEGLLQDTRNDVYL